MESSSCRIFAVEITTSVYLLDDCTPGLTTDDGAWRTGPFFPKDLLHHFSASGFELTYEPWH